ncbi:MAG: bifunctional methylenetetrahydrofolate dehydrogenase/methenyltetrahydrofolate cyclohydrolase FolD [Sphingomonadales bacterium]|nr:bifunctional methylenetetrahydrofolate dehydrogenase/methenyltetrahydrofolate cyclohydrolase FolD [Sphingomonadales bacterium]
MAAATVIDGKAVASRVRAHVRTAVERLQREHGFVPGLAVVLIGEDPASKVYVRNKAQQTAESGMKSVEHKLPVETSEADLLALVAALNRDPTIHGILVQMPLPPHIDALKVIEAIDPMKDVDGFHAVNVGRLSIGERALVPCTPSGSLILAKTVMPDLRGATAVVIGRSNIVGKPMAQLLVREDCTVTIAHSKTRDLPAVCRTADLLIAAVGRPEMVKAAWVKPGAVVIDVGINRVVGADGKGRLVGDVAYDEVAAVAGAITPVPGGVGPMTIACLLKNTVEAAEMQHGLPVTAIAI